MKHTKQNRKLVPSSLKQIYVWISKQKYPCFEVVEHSFLVPIDALFTIIFKPLAFGQAKLAKCKFS